MNANRFNLAIYFAALATAAAQAGNKPVIREYIAETGFMQALQLENDKPLYSKQSEYQRIEVHENRFYGKILVLDGVVQLTERDANAYNEMMAHVPLMQHLNPERVLVIGGGDGYVVSEVLKHPSVKHVDHVDLDGEVIETCKEFFSWGSAWSDPRVQLHLVDGAKFIMNTPDEYYDVIIQDSSDPSAFDEVLDQEIELPSAVLYSPSHFGNIYRALKPDGIFNLQGECLQIPNDLQGVVQWRQQALQIGFASAKYGSITISSYPTGQIGFIMCEKQLSDAVMTQRIQQRYVEICESGHPTTYYHPKLQRSAFDLPLWAERIIYGSELGGGPLSCEAEATASF